MSAPSARSIGWKETVSFPDWGIDGVSAKSDTGARSSALDVHDIVELPDGRLAFDVILDRGSALRTQRVEAEIADRVTIRSSNGQSQQRYRIRTRLRIGEIEKVAEFSLAARRKMIHRVLLGRTFLAPDFLVDASAKYVLSEPPRRRRKVRQSVAKTEKAPKPKRPKRTQ
jgi:hypothetical protein